MRLSSQKTVEVIYSCSKHLLKPKHRCQCFSIHIPEAILQSLDSGMISCTLLQDPGVSSLERVPILLWPALQHVEPWAELLPQHCLGRWQHQRLPRTLLLSKKFLKEYGKKVQVFLWLSQGNPQPVTLCRELVPASLKCGTLTNSCYFLTNQVSLWKWSNHH